ncbi:AAA family ATPase [Vibrio parahaemolyticus]|nr:AAA family ATPase [Vibrio parahaemolyticus]
MKIAHIYIEEHKAIKALNIPINGNFECSYNNKKLILKKSELDLSDYYRNIDISAIIGKNGTGKTTILDFLETLILPSDSNGIIVFYCESKYRFFICNINRCEIESVEIISSNNDIPVSYEHISNSAYFIKKNKINLVNINNIPSEQAGLTLKGNRTNPHIINLSLKSYIKNQSKIREYFSKLLTYFKKYYEYEPFQEKIYFELKIGQSPVRIFNRVNYFLSERESGIDVSKEWLRNVNVRQLFKDSTPFNNLIGFNALSILSHLSKSADERPENQDVILYYFIRIFLIIKEENDMAYHNILRETVRSLDFRENWSEIIINQKINPPREMDELYNIIDFKNLRKKLELIIEKLTVLSGLMVDHGLEYSEFKQNTFELDDYNLINDISNILDDLPTDLSSNVRMGWRGISTGELAFSHIFSETFHYFNDLSSYNENNIIIIDEVDLYLHPEWQREFIYKYLVLISHCQQINNIASPQVILTTHSPIITGDFLPKDIVSLYKEIDEYDNENIVIKPSLGFGTSISDLYLTGMHLRAVFGEHSKAYIDLILEHAKGGELTEFDKKLIEQISDKHIRQYLLAL